jgi:hypothetical protein
MWKNLPKGARNYMEFGFLALLCAFLLSGLLRYIFFGRQAGRYGGVKKKFGELRTLPGYSGAHYLLVNVWVKSPVNFTAAASYGILKSTCVIYFAKASVLLKPNCSKIYSTSEFRAAVLMVEFFGIISKYVKISWWVSLGLSKTVV